MTAIEAIDNLPDEVQAIVDAAARLNSQQRHALERALSDIDGLNPLTDPATSRRRRIGLVVTTLSCLGLGAWVGVPPCESPVARVDPGCSGARACASASTPPDGYRINSEWTLQASG
jgi:hypothetical protein